MRLLEQLDMTSQTVTKTITKEIIQGEESDENNFQRRKKNADDVSDAGFEEEKE